MKYKVIKSREINENGKTSYEVTIATPIGQFVGVAKLHPEDEDKKERFFGYDIATLKALRKALIYKKKLIKLKLKYSDINMPIDTSIENYISAKNELKNIQFDLANVAFEIRASLTTTPIIHNLVNEKYSSNGDGGQKPSE